MEHPVDGSTSLAVLSQIGVDLHFCLSVSIVRVFSDNKDEIWRVERVNIMQCCFHKIAAQKIVEHSIGDGGHQAVAWRFKCNAAIVRSSEVDRVRLTSD